VIASVRGRVLALAPDSAVIEVGGVGMLVQCAPHTLATLRLDETAVVFTSLVVREDSLTLFGFGSVDERSVFDLLQSASGVGPKLAQAMLAVHRPDDLRRAIASSDLVTLTQVPGIGRKGAERIVVELRDRIGPPLGDSGGDVASAMTGDAAWRPALVQALIGLGWSSREADQAADDVAPSAASGASLPELLREALRGLRRMA
jgi:Holliday junction DNA helicase RuvA